MLNLHRQNVNELLINGYFDNKEQTIVGRNIFPYLFNEFKRTYFEIQRSNPNDRNNLSSKERNTEISYLVFFIGISDENRSHLLTLLNKYFNDEDVITELVDKFKDSNKKILLIIISHHLIMNFIKTVLYISISMVIYLH